MADVEIPKLERVLSLTPLRDKEAVRIIVDERGDSDDEEEPMLLMVGKWLTVKNIDFEAFYDSMAEEALGLRKGLDIIDLEGDGKFLFRVYDESDKQKVLDGMSFSLFNGSLFLLSDVPQDMNPLDVDLSWCSFYVRIHGLPLSKQTELIAAQIANSIGVFEEYDKNERLGVTLRVRVKIDVTKPLMRFLKVVDYWTGKEVVARFTYESLPNYCYLCGHLDHELIDCKSGNGRLNQEMPYGPWLREKSSRPQILRHFDPDPADCKSYYKQGKRVKETDKISMVKGGIQAKEGNKIAYNEEIGEFEFTKVFPGKEITT